MATSTITGAKRVKTRAALKNRSKVSAAKAETRRAIHWLTAASAILASLDDEAAMPLATEAASLLSALEALSEKLAGVSE